MKTSLLRPLLVSCALSGLLIFLAGGCGKGRLANQPLTVRPEQAYDDLRQVRLAQAAERGDLAEIDAALKAGADLNALGRERVSVLWYALAADQKKAFAHLLDLGANPDVEGGQTGIRPAVMCILNDLDPDYLRLLLEHHANPTATAREEGHPLIEYAIRAESNAPLELLLQAGVDVEARVNGSPPIVEASNGGQMEKVLILLQHGADPFRRGVNDCDVTNGLFSLSYEPNSARSRAREKVLKALEARGAKFDPAIIQRFKVKNLAEASGKEPPSRFREGDSHRINPEWLKAHPEWVKAHPQWAKDAAATP